MPKCFFPHSSAHACLQFWRTGIFNHHLYFLCLFLKLYTQYKAGSQSVNLASDPQQHLVLSLLTVINSTAELIQFSPQSCTVFTK